MTDFQSKQDLRDSQWFVVLTVPQQALRAVYRLHELELELFVPVIRKRVKTGRTGRNGHKVTRVVARPMFPGYGFVRRRGIADINQLIDVRGVSNVLRIQGKPVLLPDAAVMAIFTKQIEQQREWIAQSAGGRRVPTFKRGDRVRVDDDGGVYAGLAATVDMIDSKGRIQVLFGMIRHTLPAEMVVAA
jgi:transcription antitermination factor NusG